MSLVPGTVPTHPSLDAWIAREAVPFALDVPGGLNAAIYRIMASPAGSADLLGFGEALHGGEEIMLLRNRLFLRLVETYGFSAIAIESSFPRGRLVDDYVNGRGPTAYDEIQDAGFGNRFGQLAANQSVPRARSLRSG